MKFGLFRRTPGTDTIPALYGAIVAQARLPAFYRDYGVPDTVTGRLEMILIHTFLFFRRTRSGTEAFRHLGQQVFDRFCDDMDASLREMGIGDLAVPKHMKRIGEAFYGRAAAYDTGLDARDDAELEQALLRNVFVDAEAQPERARRLAGYVRASDAQLAREEDINLAQGRISFPDPEILAQSR
jgi:cytochrome b pre-mRNA-processing protein 3